MDAGGRLQLCPEQGDERRIDQQFLEKFKAAPVVGEFAIMLCADERCLRT
jgi:hypothetical protein